MAIMKKVALTAVAAAAGLVAFRFGRIVVRVIREEFAANSAKTPKAPAAKSHAK